MKAFVDENTCIGCGLCVSICDEVFSMSASGVAEAGPVDPLNEEATREACDSCPVGAISIEE
ncbi:MAG TPA: ferredoxin [Clostridium sp.]|nr:ferredoxin [Clostridium sp.]